MLLAMLVGAYSLLKSHPATLLIQFEDETGGTLPHRIYLDAVLVATLAAGDTEHTLTGLEWNTEYTVSIYSFDDPVESNELTVDIWTAPEDAPSLAAAATGENSIELTLTPPAVTPASLEAGTGYSIEQSPNGTTGWNEIEVVAVGDQPAEVTGLVAGTQYFFRARSVNGNPSPHDPGYSAYSSSVSDTTDADATGPTNSAVSAVAGDTVADLAATSSETGTRYWYVGTSATPPSQGDLVAGTGAVYASNEACTAAVSATQQATGLTNGVTYYLHTNAKDTANNFSTIATTAGFTPAVPLSYYDEVMADSPVRYFRLGEASGAAVVDATGTANGTYTGGITYSETGAISGDTAIRTNGSTGYATLYSLPTSGSYTVECFLLMASQLNLIPVASRTASNARGMDIVIGGTSTAGRVTFRVMVVDGGASYDVQVDGVADGWHHFAMTLNGTTMTAYIDGASVGSIAVTTPAGNTQSLTLGKRGTTYSAFTFDEVAIYTTALSGARIAAHAAAV